MKHKKQVEEQLAKQLKQSTHRPGENFPFGQITDDQNTTIIQSMFSQPNRNYYKIPLLRC